MSRNRKRITRVLSLSGRGTEGSIVAVLDVAAALVRTVPETNAPWADYYVSETPVGESYEAVFVLGETYFDLVRHDVATVVSVEVHRETGDSGSAGEQTRDLMLVVEYAATGGSATDSDDRRQFERVPADQFLEQVSPEDISVAVTPSLQADAGLGTTADVDVTTEGDVGATTDPSVPGRYLPQEEFGGPTASERADKVPVRL